MKIIHFLQSNVFSGAENVVCQIINMLKEYPNIEMVYCSLDGPIRTALKEQNIKFIPLSEFSIGGLKKVLVKEKPDVVHAHDMRASFIASLACTTERIISHIHNNNFDSRGFNLKSLAYILPAIRSSHIFYVSQSSYEGYYFHNLFKKKSSVLYNVLNTEALIKKMSQDNNNYDYDVIFLGRLTEPKNPLRLLDVLKLAIDVKPDLKIAIVGSGDLEQITKEKCIALNLQKNITFLGYCSNPLKILHDSKMMIMTSLWEGTPMCALEAMALGVPIVSTPTDGLNDLIIHGMTGYLSDNNAELSQYIVKLASDDKTLNTMRIESKHKANIFNNIKKYSTEILKAYGC